MAVSIEKPRSAATAEQKADPNFYKEKYYQFLEGLGLRPEVLDPAAARNFQERGHLTSDYLEFKEEKPDTEPMVTYRQDGEEDLNLSASNAANAALKELRGIFPEFAEYISTDPQALSAIKHGARPEQISAGVVDFSPNRNNGFDRLAQPVAHAALDRSEEKLKAAAKSLDDTKATLAATAKFIFYSNIWDPTTGEAHGERSAKEALSNLLGGAYGLFDSIVLSEILEEDPVAASVQVVADSPKYARGAAKGAIAGATASAADSFDVIENLLTFTEGMSPVARTIGAAAIGGAAWAGKYGVDQTRQNLNDKLDRWTPNLDSEDAKSLSALLNYWKKNPSEAPDKEVMDRMNLEILSLRHVDQVIQGVDEITGHADQVYYKSSNVIEGDVVDALIDKAVELFIDKLKKEYKLDAEHTKQQRRNRVRKVATAAVEKFGGRAGAVAAAATK